MSTNELKLADAFNDRRRITAAFGLLVELVDKAALAGGDTEFASTAGADLLAMFHRDLLANDERLFGLLKATGIRL